MGNNNYCLSQNQKVLTLEKNTESLTITKQPIKLPLPSRNYQIEIIYQKLISQKPIVYSIEKVKQRYQPVRISIFGEQGIYLGDIKDSKPHGPGQLYFRNHNFLQATFNLGQINSDDALLIENNGNYYRGGFKESVQTGYGTLRASGSEWKGHFSSGKMTGIHSDIKNGNKYKGTFVSGKMEGKGILTYKNGAVYEGYFKGGLRHGIGHLKEKNYEYFGPFRQDKKEGKGTLFLSNDRKFQGWFDRDKIHGYGESHYKNGQVSKYNYQHYQIQNFIG